MAPAPKFDTRERARRFLIVLGAILVLSTFASAYYGLRGAEAQHRQLAVEIGHSFYGAISAMREWNYRQGGVYVRLGPGTNPNSYLKDPLREVETTTGLKLTLINHAQMTRLLAELLADQKGIHLHITSLHPLRPENAPDPWERHALELFEQGREEESTVVREGNGSTFRYMAPLKTNDSCIPCHNTPQDLSNVVRGGISIAFSYDWFMRSIADERQRILAVHAAFLVLGLGLIMVTGQRLMMSIHALQESLATIKRLEGFLPICAQCKKIRIDGGDQRRQDSWVSIESYIEARTDAEFTHGLCPACTRQLYPQLFADRDPRDAR